MAGAGKLQAGYLSVGAEGEIFFVASPYSLPCWAELLWLCLVSLIKVPEVLSAGGSGYTMSHQSLHPSTGSRKQRRKLSFQDGAQPSVTARHPRKSPWAAPPDLLHWDKLGISSQSLPACRFKQTHEWPVRFSSNPFSKSPWLAGGPYTVKQCHCSACIHHPAPPSRAHHLLRTSSRIFRLSLSPALTVTL